MQKEFCRDEDALLFRKFAKQRTIKNGNRGGAQGHYAVTPSGELLAASSSANYKVLVEMMKQGLAKWETLPREKRLLPKSPDPKAANNWRKKENLYPDDGLVLRVVARDQKRERWPDSNLDYAWFRKDEARTLFADKPKKGAKHDVPRELVERLARFHLLDNVHALNYTFFPKEAIEKARLTSTVVQIKGELVSLSFEGETRASLVSPKKIGYEPKLLGRATFNLKEQKFVSFELLAVGLRWGLGNCNQRHNPTPALMGVVFTLTGDSQAERLPPAFFSRYGW
ncbi:MAG: hypothetical protein QF685_07840 [Verrucomicrobiota bacterium]|jgi:hypothetical protein|nr:hypothetical protein [Verrucomicrobiota bacterium]